MALKRGPTTEEARLDALHRFNILDSAPEEIFDDMVAIAADVFQVPTVLITFVTEDKLWIKAKLGFNASETDRSASFCTHAIKQADIFEICDTRLDQRFAANPLVLEKPNIRYYAGAALRTGEGHVIGTLCLMDNKPNRPLSKVQRGLLQKLAHQIVDQIELRSLRIDDELVKLVTARMSDAMVLIDADNIITQWNTRAETLFGWSKEEATGQCSNMIVAPRHVTLFEKGLRDAVSGSLDKPIEMTGLRSDGHEFPAELSITHWNSTKTGKIEGFAAIIRDISERKILEEERTQALQFLDEVIENLPVMVWVKDLETRRYKMLNKVGEKLVGRKRAEVVGKCDEELFPEVAEIYKSRDEKAIAKGGGSIFEGEFVRADGSTRRMRTKRTLVGGESEAPYILGISVDITDRHVAEQKIAHMAFHDPLTGLRNRAGIAKDYERLKGRTTHTGLAVLCIDLDQFKSVNDLHGHNIGDQLLCKFGSRFTEALPDNAVVGRMGGDEFLAIIPTQNVESRAAHIAEKVLKRLSKHYDLDGKSIHADLSIGIAVSVDGEANFETLCQSADRALHRAKTQGRGQFCFFDEAMDRQASERRSLELELHQTIAARELQVHYQPLACLESGQIKGFEALVRWQHPTKGYISPYVFVPIAEESFLINELGDFVLETAMREAASWNSPLRIAVNLSPIQFRDKNLIPKIKKLLVETNLDPKRLELEITEGVLIHDTNAALSTLEQLREIGIRIAMDDFGTGYSSLSYFRMFPFDKVKIDQSFVGDMTENPQSLAIVQAVIGLGKGLGLSVVGEGVETEEQLVSLREEGCSMVQGFHISRPQPIEYFAGIVKNSLGLGGAKKAKAG